MDGFDWTNGMVRINWSFPVLCWLKISIYEKIPVYQTDLCEQGEVTPIIKHVEDSSKLHMRT